MALYWTHKAQEDLARLYQFACHHSRQHADDVLDRLLSGGDTITAQPGIGKIQPRYAPREVRKVLFDEYEVHYECRNDDIYIVDLWHTKEERAG